MDINLPGPSRAPDPSPDPSPEIAPAIAPENSSSEEELEAFWHNEIIISFLSLQFFEEPVVSFGKLTNQRERIKSRESLLLSQNGISCQIKTSGLNNNNTDVVDDEEEENVLTFKLKKEKYVDINLMFDQLFEFFFVQKNQIHSINTFLNFLYKNAIIDDNQTNNNQHDYLNYRIIGKVINNISKIKINPSTKTDVMIILLIFPNKTWMLLFIDIHVNSSNKLIDILNTINISHEIITRIIHVHDNIFPHFIIETAYRNIEPCQNIKTMTNIPLPIRDQYLGDNLFENILLLNINSFTVGKYVFKKNLNYIIFNNQNKNLIINSYIDEFLAFEIQKNDIIKDTFEIKEDHYIQFQLNETKGNLVKKLFENIIINDEPVYDPNSFKLLIIDVKLSSQLEQEIMVNYLKRWIE